MDNKQARQLVEDLLLAAMVVKNEWPVSKGSWHKREDIYRVIHLAARVIEDSLLYPQPGSPDFVMQAVRTGEGEQEDASGRSSR